MLFLMSKRDSTAGQIGSRQSRILTGEAEKSWVTQLGPDEIKQDCKNFQKQQKDRKKRGVDYGIQKKGKERK